MYYIKHYICNLLPIYYNVSLYKKYWLACAIAWLYNKLLDRIFLHCMEKNRPFSCIMWKIHSALKIGHFNVALRIFFYSVCSKKCNFTSKLICKYRNNNSIMLRWSAKNEKSQFSVFRVCDWQNKFCVFNSDWSIHWLNFAYQLELKIQNLFYHSQNQSLVLTTKNKQN